MILCSLGRRDGVPPSHPVNPILETLRDLDNPGDPWGDAMLALGALDDIMGLDLAPGEDCPHADDPIVRYVLEVLGWTTAPPVDDGPYTWPTLVPLPDTAQATPDQAAAYLRHAYAVSDRRESYCRSLGLNY